LLEPQFTEARQAMVDAERGKIVSPPESRIYPGTKPSPRGTPMREEELVFGGGVVAPEEPAAPAPKPAPKPRPRAQPSAQPRPPAGAAAAPLKPIKASDALMGAMETMDPKSEAYQNAIKQLNMLLDQGN
jgi:hypothetical protein